MKLTAQTRYALRILLDIAAAPGDAPRPIKEIASSQGISEKFIARIVVPLRRAGLVDTARGVRGGLLLGRFPEKITLLDIVQATDGPLAIATCLARPGTCPRQGRCAAECAWRRANDALSAALSTLTLADVLSDARRLSPPSPSEPDYCI
jgi:Rrf2 family protein